METIMNWHKVANRLHAEAVLHSNLAVTALNASQLEAALRHRLLSDLLHSLTAALREGYE